MVHAKITFSDGLTDYIEIHITGSDPAVADSDGNGIDDGDEDFDDDGLTNLEELDIDTQPLNPDSDNDGLSDGDEVYIYGTDPLSADSDRDGLPNALEIEYGTAPNDADSNGGGVPDGEELYPVELVYDDADEDDVILPTVTIDAAGQDIGSVRVEKVPDYDMFLNDEMPGWIGNAASCGLRAERPRGSSPPPRR
ncbi:MAG: thrombospondin type 3 repeat-containing protein [Clostridiales bacterium]|nr:thrombospondin type 3 repeat-containing protein [Clostridiales bacterium]